MRNANVVSNLKGVAIKIKGIKENSILATQGLTTDELKGQIVKMLKPIRISHFNEQEVEDYCGRPVLVITIEQKAFASSSDFAYLVRLQLLIDVENSITDTETRGVVWEEEWFGLVHLDKARERVEFAVAHLMDKFTADRE